jgi:hypothetical protein
LALDQSGENARDARERSFEMEGESAITIRDMVTTGLALPVLNGTELAMMTISNDGMESGVGDAEIRTGGIGAKDAITVDGFGATASPFDLRPRERGVSCREVLLSRHHLGRVTGGAKMGVTWFGRTRGRRVMRREEQGRRKKASAAGFTEAQELEEQDTQEKPCEEVKVSILRSRKGERESFSMGATPDKPTHQEKQSYNKQTETVKGKVFHKKSPLQA